MMLLVVAGPDLRKSNGFQALFVLEPFYRDIHSYQVNWLYLSRVWNMLNR